MTRNELFHHHSAECYRLLSNILEGPPQTASISRWQEAAAELQGQVHDDISGGWSQLLETLSHLHINDPALIPLQVEYTRLFQGPRKAQVPLWESVWRDSQHLVMSPLEQEVRDSYLQVGVVYDGIGNIPADHISLELGFLSMLSQSLKQQPCEVTSRVREDFLCKHLLVWGKSYAFQLRCEAREPLYVSTGAALEELLLWEELATKQSPAATLISDS